jgi:hypothetical protein
MRARGCLVEARIVLGHGAWRHHRLAGRARPPSARKAGRLREAAVPQRGASGCRPRACPEESMRFFNEAAGGQ